MFFKFRPLPCLLVTLLAGSVLVGCGGSTEPKGLLPSATAADPDSGTVGTLVAISGSEFRDGATVQFGDFPATGVTVVSSNLLTAYAPDSVTVGTTYTLTVTNPGGKSDAMANAWKAVLPDLRVVNGVSKPSGLTGSTILFEGRAFGDLLGKGKVFFTDVGGQPVEAPVALEENWTNEFIVTVVPNSAATGPVWVETATGVSRTIDFRIDTGATFSPSQIFWTQTGSLPDSSQGHGAAFLGNDDRAGVDNVIYLTGGAGGNLAPRADVWRGTVDPVGSIGSWTAMASLPEPRALHGMALATPFNAYIDTAAAGQIYVVGGIDSSGAPTPQVFRAPVSLSRSVGTWTQEMSLPVALHSMGITIFRSWLYVAGGAAAGDSAVSTVYRAHILYDGTLGPWEEQAGLPAPRAYAKLVQFAGILYVVGGDAGSTPPGSASVTGTQSAAIVYHPLDLRTGELGSAGWTANPSTLIKAVAKHTVLVAGGTILVSGGVYNGAANSSSEHQYATINVDGTIQSFNGATGSQTIKSQGGEPMFNHAAIVYVDGSGNAHVVMLGGNSAANPGTPVADVWYY